MKIFLIGKDDLNWSTAKDFEYTKQALIRAGHTITRNPFRADIIYATWWNLLFSRRFYFLKFFKKSIATLTNNPEPHYHDFLKIKDSVVHWVVANSQQELFLLNQGVSPNSISLNPFYVPEKEFFPLKLRRKLILKDLKISPKLLEGKVVVSSIQRDSLGTNLEKPKPQKNPDLLLECIKSIQNPFVILAGPRRHYIRRRLKELNIPFTFIGEVTSDDDMFKNNLNNKTLNLIYNVSDLYIISSSMEGGPKAVFEAALTQTLILSTPVGIANDFLPSSCIFSNHKEFKEILDAALSQTNTHTERNYKKALGINRESLFENRINRIVHAASKSLRQRY